MLKESQYYKDAAAILKKADTLIIQREGDKVYLTDSHFVLEVLYAHYEMFIMPKLNGQALTLADGQTVQRLDAKSRCTETGKMQFARMLADNGRKPFKRSGILLDIGAKVPAELLYADDGSYAVVNSAYMHILDTLPTWDGEEKTITGINYKSIIAITMEGAALYVLPINANEKKTMIENIVAALTGKAQKPATRSERVEAARAEAEQIIQAANAEAARITETATAEAAEIIRAARETATHEYNETRLKALDVVEAAERKAAEITATAKPVKAAAAAVPVAEIHAAPAKPAETAPAALVIDAAVIGDYIPADDSQDAETAAEPGICACTVTAADTAAACIVTAAAFTVAASSRRAGYTRRW